MDSVDQIGAPSIRVTRVSSLVPAPSRSVASDRRVPARADAGRDRHCAQPAGPTRAPSPWA